MEQLVITHGRRVPIGRRMCRIRIRARQRLPRIRIATVRGAPAITRVRRARLGRLRCRFRIRVRVWLRIR